MLSRNVIVLLVVSMLWVSGCSTKVTGEVFVVINSGQSVKLGLVNIYAIPASDLSAFTQAAIKDYSAAVAKAIPLLEQADFNPEVKDYLEGRDFQFALHKKYCRESWIINCDVKLPKPEKQQIFDRANRLNNSINKKGDILLEAEKLINASDVRKIDNAILRIAPYVKKEAVIKTQSDSDGKYTLELPRGDYVLVATSGRPGMKEEYLWLVKLKSGATQVKLANDNMFNSKCDDCLISKADYSALETDEKKLAALGNNPKWGEVLHGGPITNGSMFLYILSEHKKNGISEASLDTYGFTSVFRKVFDYALSAGVIKKPDNWFKD